MKKVFEIERDVEFFDSIILGKDVSIHERICFLSYKTIQELNLNINDKVLIEQEEKKYCAKVNYSKEISNESK
jgi:hypothetical protein